jgi:hypothetical protein
VTGVIEETRRQQHENGSQEGPDEDVREPRGRDVDVCPNASVVSSVGASPSSSKAAMSCKSSSVVGTNSDKSHS